MEIITYVLVAILLHGLYKLMHQWMEHDHSTYTKYMDEHLTDTKHQSH